MRDSITTRKIHSNRELGFQTHSDTPSGMNNSSQIGWRSVNISGENAAKLSDNVGAFGEYKAAFLK
jgi:hypothetical protein